MKPLFPNARPVQQLLSLFFIWIVLTLLTTLLMAVAMQAGFSLTEPATLVSIQIISQIIQFVLTAILYALLFLGSPRQTLYLAATKRNYRQAPIAAVIIILLIPLVDWLTVLNDSLHLPSSMAPLETALRSISDSNEALLQPILLNPSPMAFMINILFIAICPAICEELFFRSSLQQAFQRSLRNPHWAIVITAAIFSLAHGEIFAFLPRFALGLILGYLFHLSSSAFVNATAHFANNAIIAVLYYLHATGVVGTSPDAPLSVSPFLTLAATLAAGLLLYYYFIRPSQTKTQAATPEQAQGSKNAMRTQERSE